MAVRFIQKKVNLAEFLCGNGIDLHAHLLPGADDGAQSIWEAVSSLQALYEAGIRRVFLTPHIRPTASAGHGRQLREKFESFKAYVPPGVDVRLAAEYMLDGGSVGHVRSGAFTIGSGKSILMEMPVMSPPLAMHRVIFELRTDGFTPVLAHPERYLCLEREHYHMLKTGGCKLQLNLFSLNGYYGSHARKNAYYMLKERLYDFVGSDIHSENKFLSQLERLRLSHAQKDELKGLFANNETLWNDNT